MITDVERKSSGKLSPKEGSLREAARIIGLADYSTDEFVATAVWWLAEQLGSVEIIRCRKGGRWLVSCGEYVAGDSRLDWALAGTVLAIEEAK